MADDPGLIVRIAARGDGLTADGRHVAGAAPGDRLAEDGTLIPGPHHVAPPCPHFARCGGCTLQQCDEPSLGQFVHDRVVHALDGQGLTATTVHPVHLSPPETRRRMSLRALWAGKQLMLGYSEEGSHRVVDLTTCPVAAPALTALLAPLRALARGHMRPRQSWQIKLALTDQGVDCTITGFVAEGLAAHEALSDFARDHALARLSLDHGYGPEACWEPEPVTVTLGGVAVPYPPFAFVQATSDGEATLIAAVRAIVGDAPRVADLFTGLGTFALSLCDGRKVFAAEAERAAILSLQSAANRAGLRLFTEHRDLFRRPLTTSELSKCDAVVLDPPRAGAREQVRNLAAACVPRIAYVSCNPSSFARDARTLVDGGYTLTDLYPVGQFRWSTHVELVAGFTKRAI